MTGEEINQEFDKAHAQIREARQRLQELRALRTPDPVEDYELTSTADDTPVRLSALFGDRSELIVIHNMGSRCPMCTTWADGFNGLQHHIRNRAGFVVSTPDAPEAQRAFAEGRGWRFPMVSTRGTTFAKDLGMESEHNGEPFPVPGISCFRRNDDGSIVRTDYDYFGPGDLYCSLWALLELLPGGQGEWWPQLSYA